VAFRKQRIVGPSEHPGKLQPGWHSDCSRLPFRRYDLCGWNQWNVRERNYSSSDVKPSITPQEAN
jgi:hypothetical protein